MSQYDKSRIQRLKQTKYINLKVSGRLFPSWVLANFNKFKLPKIVKKPGEDPCNVRVANPTGKRELRTYQKFASIFLDYKSPYRDILLYHGMGSGKTAGAINVYNSLYNYTPGWNVFILIPASIKGSWLDDLKKWLRKDEYEYRYKNIIFIHYDSPFADRNFMDAIKNIDTSKKNMYIIDEVHNFIRNVYSNISSQEGRRAQVIYDHIIQDKKDNPDTRVILLSATPAINKPFEMALLFNLLRPDIFPKSETEFGHLFISGSSYQTINTVNKNMFQRRIMGLVSYYIGATPDRYATKTIHYVNVPMSKYQENIYSYYEEIETKISMNQRFGSKGSQTYKTYTRQASNFVFPAISQRVNGEGRPRPNKFKVSESAATTMMEGRDKKKEKQQKQQKMNKYYEAMNEYTTAFDQYLNKFHLDDEKQKHTIFNDIETFKKKYKGNFDKFFSEEKKKSKLFDAMQNSSRKMVHMLFNIMNSPGSVLVYSNYVLMEGLEIFKIYLKQLGFYSFMKTKKIDPNNFGYVEFHGGITFEDRIIGMREFNKSENKLGNLLKIILISPAGSEGLNLRNVRQVHIMEPYWNEVRITQMRGRAIRQCSHEELPMEERHVDIYRYKSVRADSDRQTTDQFIENHARNKDGLIQSFLDAIKEVAIDCVLYSNHNMMVQEYKCFQFEEKAQFDRYIGPAYKQDIYDDMKINNGLNSTKSMSLKVKVIKTQAVILMSKPEEEPKYSKAKEYYFNPKSGVVYDLELHYPIGKVSFDDNNLPIKLDKNTYIIDYIIPIPMINE